MGASISNNRNQFSMIVRQYSMKGRAKLFACNQNRRYLITINQHDRLIIQGVRNGQIMKTSNIFRKKRTMVQDVNEAYIEKCLGRYLSWIRQSSVASFITTRTNKIIRNCTKINKHPTKPGADLIFIYKSRYLIWDPFTGKLGTIGDVIDSNSYLIALSPINTQFAQVQYYIEYGFDEVPDREHHQVGTGDCITGLYYNGIKKLGKGCSPIDINEADIITYSPDGRLLLILSWIRFEIRDSFSVNKLWTSRSGQLQSCTFSLDSKFLIVVKSRKVNIYLSMTGEMVYSFQVSKEPEQQELYILLGEVGQNKIGVLKLKDSTKVH